MTGSPSSWRTGESSERLLGEPVSPGLFEVLGVDALYGRTFRAGEDEPGADAVVVLSYGLWQRLGGDPGLVGHTIRLDGQVRTVVGVMPRHLRFSERTDVWFPLVGQREEERSRRWINNVVVRLAPGVPLDRARAEAKVLSEWLARAYPDSNKDLSFHIFPFRERLVEAGTRRVLALLFGAVVFVLLIACLNVANLLLARESTRKRPAAAIRLALGSSRAHLVRQLMT